MGANSFKHRKWTRMKEKLVRKLKPSLQSHTLELLSKTKSQKRDRERSDGPAMRGKENEWDGTVLHFYEL